MNATSENFLYEFVVLTILAMVIQANADCDERPPFVNPKRCCQMPDIITDDVKETCQQYMKPPRGPPGSMEEKNGPPKPPRGIRGPHHCFTSCVFNETGILIDKELQADILITYLENAIEDKELAEVLSKNFIECSEKLKTIRENMEKKFGPGPGPGRGPLHHRCPPHGDILMKCAFMKTFKECPESIWSDTDECNAVRNYIIECKSPDPDDDKVENEEI